MAYGQIHFQSSMTFQPRGWAVRLLRHAAPRKRGGVGFVRLSCCAPMSRVAGSASMLL